MTYEIIGISGSISNDDEFVIAASSNAAKAAGTRPLARAPDHPLSTR
jgi:hypothetical protein